MILSDSETKVDLLNSEAIALTIVKLIRARSDNPITIGIHGDWGAGKSSILEMIEHELHQKEKVLCIKFNGWRYQGFEDAKIALIEGIVTELIEQKSLFTKAKEQVHEIFERIDWLKVAKKAGSFAFTAFTGVPTGEVVNTFFTGLKALAADPIQYATPDNTKLLVDQASSLLKPKEAGKNVPKEISEFRKSFKKLLEAAGIDQLVVLVDDLDRCLPDTAIETLEAIRLFIFTEKTAFVIAADEGMIEYAVRKHFPDFLDTSLSQTYTRNYLEKLIQVPFKIPILGEMETKVYVTLLLVGAEIGECKEFDALISVARERLKKPWENQSISSQDIKDTLKGRADEVKNAIALSDQVGPILASGMKGNPRQIKRFLNTLLLRQLTSQARGFENLIELPVMAKLMIAERFIPHLFELIALSAAQSSDGHCKELVLLETSAEQSPQGKMETFEHEGTGKPTSQGKVKDTNTIVKAHILPPEWTNNDLILEWSKIKPALASIDLRPYLFIAKERKDYFGSSTAIGHLTSLIDKLLGKKFTVQAVTNDIKSLSSKDAQLVFEELRSRILSVTKLDIEPNGINGLSSLVKIHPELQDKLLELLTNLPANKLGVWVLKGWEGVFSGDSIAKFEVLIGSWANKGDRPLKLAASNTLKLMKK